MSVPAVAFLVGVLVATSIVTAVPRLALWRLMASSVLLGAAIDLAAWYLP